MNKKITLFALAAVSAAVLALPSMAMAVEEDIPIHVVPKPAVASPITGGVWTMQTKSGTNLTCKEVKGSATWASTTTGKTNLTFQNDCTENLFGTSCGGISTTELEFHLVTLPNSKPGVLITPNAGHMVTLTCTGGFVKIVFRGNGLIGTIVSPSCGGESTTATVTFSQTAGVQNHKTVAGTATEYFLEASVNGGPFVEAGWSETMTMTFESKKKLECT